MAMAVLVLQQQEQGKGLHKHLEKSSAHGHFLLYWTSKSIRK